MSARGPFTTRLAELQQNHRLRYDAVSLLIYQTFVYVWSLNIHPLGRDYALLHSNGADLEPLARMFWRMETTLFGNFTPGYHLVNFALLYGCTLAVYGIVRLANPDPRIWLATLAAALFMANPVHSAGVLHLSSSVDLLRAFGALGSLFLYLYAENSSKIRIHYAAFPLFIVVSVLFRGNVSLGILPLLFVALLAGDEKRMALWRALPYALCAIVAISLQLDSFTLNALHPANSLAPLYFLFYPIGFLPDTMRTFTEISYAGWLAGAAVVFVGILIYRQARAKAILFGILAAVLFRLGQGDAPIDPVHLEGSAHLLVPNALYNLALVAVFGRIMDHPKWRRTVVTGTTLFALLFFGMQIHTINTWRHAGNYVSTFQQRVERETHLSEENPLAILPDYQHYRFAPMKLSESIAYDTPFSQTTPHASMLKLNYDPEAEIETIVESDTTITLRIRHEAPWSLFPWRQPTLEAGDTIETADASAKILKETDGQLEIEISPATDRQVLYPIRNSPSSIHP